MIYINARFLTQKVTGVQRFAIEISKALIKSGIKATWIAPSNIINQHLAELLNVKIIGKHIGHIWEQIDLPHYLKSKGNPLLINLCNTAPIFYSNSIVTIHDLAFLKHPEWFTWKFRCVYKFMIPRIASSSRKIITVSEFSKKEIASLLNVPSDKIHIAYNGVSKIFSNKSSVKCLDKFILFVGSLDQRKNLLSIIDALKYLPENVSLKIAGGTASSFTSIKKKFPSHIEKRIFFLGYVNDDELIKLYNDALVFVYPSLYEGFGIPPLEAQAAGVPVVVSDIPVFREVFGTSASFCNPYDPASISKVIHKVLNLNEEEKRELKNKGYENLDRFSWDKSAEKLNDIIRQS